MEIAELKKNLLKEYTLVALPDNHNEQSARLKAHNLIESGLVKRFFIEWKQTAKSKDGNKLLNNYFNKIFEEKKRNTEVDMKDSYTETNILCTFIDEGYFEEIAKTDATPTILGLAAFAASLGVQVVAMDMDPEAVKSQLKADQTNNTILFSSQGIAVRDEFAGKEIAKFLLEGPKTNGNLMLWGANHFSVNENEYGKGIDKIIGGYRIKRDGKNVYEQEITVVVDR